MILVESAKVENITRLGYLLLNLGSAELDLGNASKARTIHENAYRIAEKENDLQLKAFVMYALGQDHHALGNHDEARRYLNDSHEVFCEIGCVAFEIEAKLFMKSIGYI